MERDVNRMLIAGDKLVQYWDKPIEVTIEEPVRVIGQQAFYDVRGVGKIVLPDTVKVIEHGAFEHCMDLEEVVLPEGLEILHAAAFADCWDLQRCNLPSSLQKIGPCAFDGTALTEIVVPPALKDLRKAALENAFHVRPCQLSHMVWPYGPEDGDGICLLETVLGDTVPETLTADKLKLEEVPKNLQPAVVRSVVQRVQMGQRPDYNLELDARVWLLDHPDEWSNLSDWWDNVFIQYMTDVGLMNKGSAWDLLNKAIRENLPDVAAQMAEYLYASHSWGGNDDVEEWYDRAKYVWQGAETSFSSEAWKGCPLLEGTVWS